jgi:Ubiquitin carboxyl-terminal hydrolase/DUSP domain
LRQRTDSWATAAGDAAAAAAAGTSSSILTLTPESPISSSSTASSVSNNNTSTNTLKKKKKKKKKHGNTPLRGVEAQWQRLWQVQAPLLVDPADVPAVLDSLQCALVNLLSPTEITFLVRRTRWVVTELDDANSNTGSFMPTLRRPSGPPQLTALLEGSRVGRALQQAVSGGTELNASSAAAAASTTLDVRQVVEKQQLLPWPVVARILRPMQVLGSGSTSRLESMENGAATIPLVESAYILMLHFSPTLWDRVMEIAAHAAAVAQLELDVNKKTTLSLLPPRPSIVPEVTHAPPLPAGVTLTSLATVLALLLRGTRAQRAQLLFYLLLPPAELTAFLAAHPAGGVPTFLLEVDQGLLLGLPSLTHYHYHGTACLPVSDPEMGPFCPSHSRPVPTIYAQTVRTVLHAVLHDAAQGRRRRTSSNPPTVVESTDNVPAPPSLLPAPSSESAATTGKRRSIKKTAAAAAAASTGGRQRPLDSVRPEPDALVEPTVTRKYPATCSSDVMQRLYQVAEWGTPAYHHEQAAAALAQFTSSWPDQEETDVQWTLADFCGWADRALNDVAWEAIGYQLLGAGVLPAPSLELELVQAKWLEWQRLVLSSSSSATAPDEPISVFESLASSLRMVLQLCDATADAATRETVRAKRPVWGGLGALDGGGGLGHGILYCVEREWWESWVRYVGWRWLGEVAQSTTTTLPRPSTLTNHLLLQQDLGQIPIPGTLGSYEVMRPGLKRHVDYVLVPPGVWDVLFELYGGGPPLPRMVQPFPAGQHHVGIGDGPYRGDASETSYDEADLEMVTDILETGSPVVKLPDNLTVEVYPWVINVQLCDPMQPYRRGDAGSLSIRVMVAPGQPMWRLYSEIICRFSFRNFKAFENGRGQARLWKRTESTTDNSKEPLPRFGPWALLCVSGHAILPLLADTIESEEAYRELVADWKSYTDNATVGSIGLTDGDCLMLEFSVLNKQGSLMWPRDAAAKAGRVRRLAEEDRLFRQTLLGVDENGSSLPNRVSLVGMEVDALDSTGRWYATSILQETARDEESEDEDGDERKPEKEPPLARRKRVKVDFAEFGGHVEWIDLDSDRLATRGRFTSEAEKQIAATDGPSNGGLKPPVGDGKVKPVSPGKKTIGAETTSETGKLCLLPGYGACGLTNLGNSCYFNAAVQCVSYLPLLRSYILSGRYKAAGDLNMTNPLGTGGKLLEEFSELMRALWSEKHGEKSPNRFRAQLGKSNSQFSGVDQQDAQEFLNYMLDVLHEDSNRVQKKPYVEALEDSWVNANRLSRVGDESWRRYAWHVLLFPSRTLPIR